MNKKAKTATEPTNHITDLQEFGIHRAPVLVTDRDTACTSAKMSMVSAT